MDALCDAVRVVQSALATCPAGPKPPVTSVTFDEGTVCFILHKPRGPVQVSVVFAAPDLYPNSPALLICEDDSETAEQLCAIGEEFEDAAVLDRVITRICGACGVNSNWLKALSLDDGHMDDSRGSSQGEVYNSLSDNCSSYGEVYEEDEYSDDGGMSSGGLEEDEDKEWTVELGKRQGRWEKHEALRRERAANSAEGAASVQGRSASESVAHTRQIFDEQAAFKMLSKELLDIMREQSMDMLVDTVGDDVYCWSVELASFNPSSGLAKDIAELQKQYSYSTVQLHFLFKRGLHPFYPPRVEVLRPRFKTPISWAVASHPMFHLSNWDPWIRQKEAILQIKTFLEKHARVDLGSPMNSILDFPDAAYSDAERQVARLEALSELPPRCISNPEYKKLYESRDVVVDKDHLDALQQPEAKRMRPKPQDREQFWAAGTGYGHGKLESDTWDAKASDLAQKAHDAEVKRLLSDFDRSLAVELGGPSVEEDSSDAMPSTSSGPSEVEADMAPERLKALVFALEGSCLLPFLLQELGGASFTDMCGRAEYYLSILKVISRICHPVTAHLLCSTKLSESTKMSSILDALELLREQAVDYGKVIGHGHKEEAKEVERRKQAGIPTSSYSSVPPGSHQHQKTQAAEKEEKMGLQLAESIISAVERLTVLMGGQDNGANQCSERNSSTSEGCKEEEYISTVRPLQLDFVSGLEESNVYSGDSCREAAYPKERMVRLSRELAGLRSLLPCTSSSSVFVRVDEQKLTLWQTMITGPDDTPYSGGCFLFDFYFPPSYPSTAPKVALKTTGGGKVRFNPNLYKCGKVCLSLLGTWSGAAGERWDAEVSTAFQVLVSIQSLILVPQPYFNEPGYEETMHTDSGKLRSRSYNQDIREHSIHRGMIDYLKKPPKEFEQAMKTHFRLRRQYILATCRKWIAEGEEAKCHAHTARLRSLVDELAVLLNEL